MPHHPTGERKPATTAPVADRGPSAEPPPAPAPAGVVRAPEGTAPRSVDVAAIAPPSSRRTAVAAPPAPPDVASKLRLEVLLYGDVPSERMAFINGRKYVEGQRLEGGLIIEKITEEGVILSGEGRQFLLRPPQ